MSSRVELFEQIRRDRRLDPLVSARALAKRYRVSARTVGVALAYAAPLPRQSYRFAAFPARPGDGLGGCDAAAGSGCSP